MSGQEGTKRLTRKAMLSMLSKLDEKLEGFQRKIRFYCLGGTIIVLDQKRHSSKDVDFIVSRQDYTAISGMLKELERSEKVPIDIFQDGIIGYYTLPNYVNRSKLLPYAFKHIELYALNKIDLLLTKAIAGREHDLDDMARIATPKDVPREVLEKRYNEIIPEEEKKEQLRAMFDKSLAQFYKK